MDEKLVWMIYDYIRLGTDPKPANLLGDADTLLETALAGPMEGAERIVFAAVTSAKPPEPQAPSTLTSGLYSSLGSIIGMIAARFPYLLNRAAMKFEITPSSTFAGSLICASAPCPASLT